MEKYSLIVSFGSLSLVLAILFLPRFGLIAQLRRWFKLRKRILIEDALKVILAAQYENQSVTANHLAGALGQAQSVTLKLIAQLMASDLVRTAQDTLQLTEKGRELALHVLRAHRLWERYLSDDAGVPLSKVHHLADRAEHHLANTEIETLEEHLGHPQTDPHGDPIPKSDGRYEFSERVLLNEWHPNRPAEVVHVEDEPAEALKQILAGGLRPGASVTITEKNEKNLAFETDLGDGRLPLNVAAQVHVTPIAESLESRSGLMKLSQLSTGKTAQVVGLAEQCRGLTRRRLLDLGLTPGTPIQAQLANAFQSARGYKVRETLIALRKEQADQVYIHTN